MAENGEENADPVANYSRPRLPYKVTLTGVCDVGKTSLFRSMFKKDFCENKPPSSTEKDTHYEKFPKDEIVIPLEIWDTAEMDRHGSVTRSYYRNSHFILLVYSAVDENSLNRLNSMARNVKDWEPRAKLIVVRNKTDLPIGDDGVTPENEKDFIRNMKTKVTAKFWTSAKNNEGVENLLRELAMSSLQMFKSKTESSDFRHGFRMDLDNEKQKNDGGSCCG